MGSLYMQSYLSLSTVKTTEQEKEMASNLATLRGGHVPIPSLRLDSEGESVDMHMSLSYLHLSVGFILTNEYCTITEWLFVFPSLSQSCCVGDHTMVLCTIVALQCVGLLCNPLS